MPWTLVTGGAKGVGAEICRHLAAQEHDLVIHYKTSRIDADNVAKACRDQGRQAQTIFGNFDSRESTLTFVEQYAQKFPETQNLVNNVGNYLIKSALETTPDQWYDLFQNNLHVPFILSRGLSDSIKTYHGAIINMGIAGLNRADASSSAYTCAKMGLLALTKALAKELTPYQVNVNMVSPGYIETSVDLPDNMRDLPTGRPATVSEVAELIAYLLSPGAKYITGQNIEIAGGVRL
jgi:NAD(P)-dependent dehydrogenase (short-subunit alcohol dehydrogenase family)